MIIKQKIALTFDDGPHPFYTPKILDLLQKHKSKALFFCAGKNAKKYPELIKRILAEGHQIGNHTWSHYPLFQNNENVLQREIVDFHDFIFDNYQYTMKFFRPPWGVFPRNIKKKMETQYNYTTLLWDVNSFDYCFPYRKNLYLFNWKKNKKTITILFHDGVILSPSTTRFHTLKMVENLLLKQSEFDFVFPTLKK